MISRVASLTSSSRPAGDDRRPSITSESDWRVRIDAGTLFVMGCLLAGAGSLRRRFAKPQQGCTPTKFSSKLRTSPSHIMTHVLTRTHFIAPKDLIEEVDRIVGPRHRSEFLTEAVREMLKRVKLLQATRKAMKF